MAPKSKSFGDTTKSRLEDIYETLEDIPKKEPRLLMEDGTKRNTRDLLDAVVRQPFISTCYKRKSLEIAEIIKPEDVLRINHVLESKKREAEGVTAIFVNVSTNPKVRFWDASFKTKGSKMQYYAPRMLINLKDEAIEPGMSVRCNTGYILKIPTYATEKRMTDKGLVKDATAKRTKQVDFVIVPMIECVGDADIVPSVTPRDPYDDSLLTINFVLVRGKIESLRVVFNAYKIAQPLGSVKLINPEPNAEIFKPKDSRSGRLVKNLKVKACFGDARIDTDGTLVVPTFNALVSPVKVFEHQYLQMRDVSVLISSRRREWCDENLVTLSGYYAANDPNEFVRPISIYRELSKNTHCVCFISTRCTLFSEQSVDRTGSKLINGAFIDIPGYSATIKALRQLIDGMETLSLGYAMCSRLKKQRPNMDIRKAMLLYDYHRRLIDDEELDARLELTEKEMYDTRPQESNAYSVNMYKSLKTLVKYVDSEKQNLTEKRCVDEDATTESEAKRQKIEG